MGIDFSPFPRPHAIPRIIRELAAIIHIHSLIYDFIVTDSETQPNRNHVNSQGRSKAIHEYIFREGVMVCEKNYELPKHPDVDVKNLYVIKACQSLTSRGYLKTQFAWQYYYYTLTPEGLDYLREWLHLP